MTVLRNIRRPAAWVLLKVEAQLVGLPENAVFALLVDLNLWVIRAEVALAASLRLARLCLGEAMTRMTGAAASGAAVWIDAPDAALGLRIAPVRWWGWLRWFCG